jgi:hypothetical protein
VLPSTQIEHTAGREGVWLLDERYWRAVCAPCGAYITRRGKAAAARGFKVLRKISTKGKQ